MRRPLALPVMLLTLATGAATAQEAMVADAGLSPDDESQLALLLQIVGEETEIATRTRMNGDFVPGIVTVLQGEEMLALGFDSVWDALSLVPGVQVARDRSGTPTVIMRGLQFPFNSGNVKILLDGLPLNREDAGLNGIVLDTPLTLVERIEVIRGPGSVVYGDFAFMGLVNIVTHGEGSRVFARVGNDDVVSGGVAANFGSAAGWHGSLAAAGVTADPARVYEPRSGSEDGLWSTASLGYGGFYLDGAFALRDLDDFAEGSGSGQIQRHGSLAARWTRELSPSLTTDLHAGYRYDYFDVPANTFDGEATEAGLTLLWEGWSRHAWMLDLEWTRSHIDQASHQRITSPPGGGSSPGGPSPGGPPAGGPPPSGGPGGAPPSGGSGGRPPDGNERGVTDLRDEQRTILSATLQDAFDIGEDVTLTAGARLDHYDDLGTRVTPRAALVWRISSAHILKLQYAEGFRPPTFFEYFNGGEANTELDFEVNATAELNYVNRSPGRVVRATLFHTELRDMIFIGRQGFGNVADARAYGVELEWQQELGSRVKAAGNVSFADAIDARNRELVRGPSPATAEWLANLGLSVRAARDTLLAARWSHVGDLNAPEIEGYDLFDLTLTRRDLLLDGLGLRLGVKNVFDDAVVYPFVGPGFTLEVPYGGRSVWAELSWSR